MSTYPHRMLLTAIITALAVAALFLPGGPMQDVRAQQTIDPADFSAAITNPLFPISLTGPKIFEGEETDPDTDEVVETRLESRVLPQTEVVAGVTVTVLEEKAFEDGVLVEVALDFFAQHRDGSVYYFGERVDNYEDGAFKDHAGQWLAGENGNEPGILMPAEPVAGQTYQQELAPGVAEDAMTVLALDESVSVPAGSYRQCVKTRDFTTLEPGIEEFKWYCPGVGLVREEGVGAVNELVSVGPATPLATPTAGPASVPAVTPSAGVVAPSAGYGDTGEGHARQAWMFAVAALLASGLCVLVVAAARIRR